MNICIQKIFLKYNMTLQNGGTMMNNNNIKNVNQNENKTLMDAPVPSPTTPSY